ncbi:hypothetical protein B689b_0528 [Bifidobacterium breve 689b]|uniref:hypothetical protein n=1 Tax=Bifidobacterium breve TaxID=1685 RepID=UPI0003EFD125|nr:hypothetical protein [Bifidobacterium breve]AHJ22591.1 hypothetical protein B689b_0528 [Bifidobacterium breve 689b]
MKSENFNRTYSTIANTLMVIIEASLCLIVGTLPLVVVAFAVNDFDYWALYIVAAALSMPGIAALFAIFRDQPTLLSMNASVRTQVWLDNESDPDFPPEWIAAPYVYPDASVMFIKSYFKAYARLFKRSLGIGVFYWFLVFCFGYDILIVLQLSWGGFIVPMLVICILMALQSMMVSLVLAVEYPKAKYVQLLKNGFLLSVRRLPVLLLTLVALGGYAWALFTWTIPVLVFASGIAAYVVWACANWQASVLFSSMAMESGDKRIIDMYHATHNSAASKSSWFRGTKDYIS